MNSALLFAKQAFEIKSQQRRGSNPHIAQLNDGGVGGGGGSGNDGNIVLQKKALVSFIFEFPLHQHMGNECMDVCL